MKRSDRFINLFFDCPSRYITLQIICLYNLQISANYHRETNKIPRSQIYYPRKIGLSWFSEMRTNHISAAPLLIRFQNVNIGDDFVVKNNSSHCYTDDSDWYIIRFSCATLPEFRAVRKHHILFSADSFQSTQCTSQKRSDCSHSIVKYTVDFNVWQVPQNKNARWQKK